MTHPGAGKGRGMPSNYTIPSLDQKTGQRLTELLQQRLVALLDLQITLKHVHWNVVGPNFIGVHEMLDPQVDEVREMSDTVAERIATLGGEPLGTPGAIVKHRSWDDYSLNRELVPGHLAALDLVYDGVITDHRKAMEEVAELDPVTEDMLIDQAADLEQFQWFIRAHLEDSSGKLRHEGTDTEQDAANAATS